MTKFQELPDKIKVHLKGVLPSSGLPDTEASLEKLATQWLTKRERFGKVTAALDMRETDHFKQADPRGALLLTYSGSLITVGSLQDGHRWVEYASLKLRSDVPGIAKSEKVQLTDDIRLDHCTGFKPGLVKRTSEILLIACCDPGLSQEEQEENIKQATLSLTEEFIKINNS